jgi:Domain of unknown function (DUF6321)
MREVVKKPTMQVPAWVQSKITIATDYMDSVANYMSSKNEEVEIEEKRGLWANIHAKRKRGERPAKPGEKGYPKTLDIEEGLKQARKNVGASRCWDNKRVDPNKPTKMKGGTEVPNCVPEGFVDPEHGETPSGRTPLQNVSDHPRASVRKRAVKAFKTQMGKEYGGKWNSRSSDPNVEESHVPGQPAERLGAVTPISQKERDAARERTLAKAAALRKKREDQKEEFEIEEGVRPGNVETPLNKAAFKKRRRSLAGKEKSAEATSRGHVGKEWYNSGRKYSPDEAKSNRANLPDHERSTRHRSSIDPEGEDSNYSADRTKNPKKLRKQKAMGELTTEAKTAAWQRKEGKNPKGGLNEKGRKSYEEENPGSDLKPPQPEGGPRKRSFCARMSGMPGPMKDENGKPTRKALSLRKWHCGRKGG